LVVRPIVELLEHFAAPKGEFTILIPPWSPPKATEMVPPDAAAIAREFGELTNRGQLKRREALKVLAERHGLAVNALYKLLGDAGS